LKHFTKYLAALFILLVACNSDEHRKVDIGLDYFPLQKGFYQVYTVDETQYSEVSDPETSHYEIMTEVVDSFPNTGEGTYTYVIYRSRRDDSSAEWEYMDTWSARVDGNEVVQTEGNTPFVKLILPVRNATTWNGNKYNTLGDDSYLVKMVDEPYTLGNIHFEKSLVVEQEKNEDPIVFRDIRQEYYAREAGLISREITQLYYCTDNGCLGQQEIKSGIEFIQQITEYGVH
jgi:hypothetical protein